MNNTTNQIFNLPITIVAILLLLGAGCAPFTTPTNGIAASASSAQLAAPDTSQIDTTTPVPTITPTPTPTPQPLLKTCAVSSNVTVVSNAADNSTASTEITFSRTGTAVGAFYWSANGATPFNQADLNSNDSHLTLSYLNIPTGFYNIHSEVHTTEGVVSCGDTIIQVIAPPIVITPTCSIQLSTSTVSNSNNNGSTKITAITFSRSGTAVGDLYWGANGATPFIQAELNNNPSAVTFSYVGIAIGNYVVHAEVHGPSGIVDCGTFNIQVTP